MTCSYIETIKGDGTSYFEKAKSECLEEKNCTAVRESHCLYYKPFDNYYSICNDTPKPAKWELTSGKSEKPCVHKEADPSGNFSC